jgi:tRNA(Ile)-lysidine synthase
LQRGLDWIEDESNFSVLHDRNYLRSEVLPRVQPRFPAYRVTLARLARHCGETQELLDTLAASDLQTAQRAEGLAVAQLSGFSPARVKNLLRYYLPRQGAPVPSNAQMQEILRQVFKARADADLCVSCGSYEVRRYRGLLQVTAPALAAESFVLPWNGEARFTCGALSGTLTFTPALGLGIGLARLKQAPVSIRSRAGGERFRPDSKRPRRTLKNLLQEHHLPSWQRRRMPLIFCGERLVWVPGIGIDCDFRAGPAEPGIEVDWHVAES